jgi:hypothetical protein
MSKIDESNGEGMPENEGSVSTEMQKIATSEVTDYRGLCWMCEGASTCTYRRDPRQPVWQCDEFECGTSPVNISPPTHSRIEFTPGNKNLGKYKGLCVNCENRQTCTYPKPEGGVWHCNEYE